ncbi:hypothetical protein SAY86_006578 [Trapa natans]|uniref:Pentatricopeptide repeat-containing protein n=1 Tax=Trapa natans TaxID=22666 RepID=A0AAN7LCD6_TRANT|nr:hypothetical protein SAY86_006578 [Trapa natans]
MISVATSCGSSIGDESGKEERRQDSSRYPRAVGGIRANARILFDDTSVRDVVSWNALICGYSRCGHNYRQWNYSYESQGKALLQDPLHWLVYSRSYAQSEFFSLGRSVHCLGIKIGTDLDPQVRNVLVWKEWGVQSARLLFEGMGVKSIVSWNTMISSYSQNGLLDNDSAMTLLLCMYANLGDMESAYNLDKSLPEKNLVSSIAIILGYAEGRKMDSDIIQYSPWSDKQFYWNQHQACFLLLWSQAWALCIFLPSKKLESAYSLFL